MKINNIEIEKMKNSCNLVRTSFSLNILNKIKILFILVISSYLQGCSGGCETAEEMMTDEKLITMHGDRRIDFSNNMLPNEVWIATGQQVEARDLTNPKFTVLVNSIDLCGINSSNSISTADVNITEFSTYSNTNIDVKEGDLIKFDLNPKKFIINCSGSDPLVAIIDIDKCKDGYSKKNSDEFVVPMEGKEVELESYIALNPTGFPMSGNFNTQIQSGVYNAFLPTSMLTNFNTTSLPLGLSDVKKTVMPGRAIIVPSEHEIPVLDKKGKTIDHMYDSFPPMNPNDALFFQYQFSSTADAGQQDRIKEESKKYWCRVFPDSYTNVITKGLVPSGMTILQSKNPISGTLNRNINMEGQTLNKFCDKYYYLDEGDNENPGNVMEYRLWESAILSNKPFGNTNTAGLIYSVIENKSYTKMDIPDMSISDSTAAPTKESYFISTHSKFFYMLNAEISLTNPQTSLDKVGNVNTDYASCNSTSLSARCNAFGDVQLPLSQAIEVKKNGKLFLRVGKLDNFFVPTPGNDAVGNANIKVTRSCPLKDLYGTFVESEAELINANNPVIPGSNKTFKIPLYENEAGTSVMIDKFEIDRNLAGTGRRKSLYLGFKDNGDGELNNTGIIKLSTRIPRDSSDEVTQFINTVFEKMMDIMYGPRTNPDIPNSPREGAKGEGIVTSIYKNMIKSERFQAILRASSLLLIVIYGISILMGLSQFNTGDLVRTVFKFGVVYTLLQPFSWDFFRDNFLNLFINGPKYLVKVVTTPPKENLNDYSEKYVLGPINDVLQRFIDFSIWKQVVSILFAGPFGWILFFFLLQSCWLFITGSLSAILTYLVSVVIVGVFISVAPLFILCLMFKKTSGIFTAWTKVLMVNTLNAVIVFSAITMVAGIASVLINQIFGFGICTDCVFTFHSPSGINFCLMYGDLPDSYDGSLSYEQRVALSKSTSTYPSAQNEFFGFPFPFFAFVCFIIMSHVVSNLSVFFALMAEDLIGVDYGSPTQAANIPSAVAENMKSFVGLGKSDKQEAVQKRARGGAKDKIELKDEDNPGKK